MSDVAASVAGVWLPFCAMNAAGTWGSARELGQLALSASGAVVLPTATVHPFVHPEFRSLHNPGYDKLALLARQLAADGTKPVVASVCGAQADEMAFLAGAFAEAGAALVELDLVEPWVDATLAPFEDAAVLHEALATIVAASPVPVVARLPEHPPIGYAAAGEALRAAGVRGVTIANAFLGLEKFLLEGGPGFDVIARGEIDSGWDVARALGKGAAAVQVTGAPTGEGLRIFERLAHELEIARARR